MAEDLTIIQGSKEEIYPSLIPQIKGLLEGEPDLIANPPMWRRRLKSNLAGCGLVLSRQGRRTGVCLPGTCCLHPYQKREERMRTSWQKAQTLIVPDVEISRPYRLQQFIKVRDRGARHPEW